MKTWPFNNSWCFLVCFYHVNCVKNFYMAVIVHWSLKQKILLMYCHKSFNPGFIRTSSSYWWFSFLTPSWPSKRKIRFLSIFEKSRIAVNYLLFLCQICSRDNLDRKLQAQELARIMDERFVCVHPFSLLLFFLFYSLFIPKCLNVHAFAAQTLWCFWDMWRHLLKVATTACWLRRDEQRLEGTVNGVLFNVVRDLYRETLMTGVHVCLGVLSLSFSRNSNWNV